MCGICGGDGSSCAVVATVVYTVSSVEGLDTPGSEQYVEFQQTFSQEMAVALGAEESQITVTSVTVITRHHRLLLQVRLFQLARVHLQGIV